MAPRECAEAADARWLRALARRMPLLRDVAKHALRAECAAGTASSLEVREVWEWSSQTRRDLSLSRQDTWHDRDIARPAGAAKRLA
jgi:hypothetical protein